MIKKTVILIWDRCVIQILSPRLGKDCTWESPSTRTLLGNLGPGITVICVRWSHHSHSETTGRTKPRGASSLSHTVRP